MPTPQTLKNIGLLHTQDHLTDGPAIRNARKLLQETAQTFAKQSAAFYDFVGEFPFIYREPKLHSVLFPALVKVSDAAFMEQPITRTLTKNSSHGWVDYWVSFHSSIFLIELKHAWNSLRTEAVTHRTQNSWTQALEQLNKIDPDDIPNLSRTARSVATMALMVVPFFQAANAQEGLRNFEGEELINAYTALLEGLSPQSNWSSLWLLHPRFEEIDFSGRFEKYPAVAIVAQVIPVR